MIHSLKEITLVVADVSTIVESAYGKKTLTRMRNG
jgi:hypothetical protein